MFKYILIFNIENIDVYVLFPFDIRTLAVIFFLVHFGKDESLFFFIISACFKYTILNEFITTEKKLEIGVLCIIKWTIVSYKFK